MTCKLCAAAALLSALSLCAIPACGEGLLGVTTSYTAAPSEAPAATSAPSATPSASPAFSAPEDADSAALGERILMRGMAGEDVAIVQRRLYELGYYLDEVDGVFGLKTRSAVYAFQRAHKLEKIDGKVGPQTIAALFSQDAIVNPTPTPTPSPTPRPTPTPTFTPTPSPVPTATPDVQSAPFTLDSASLYIADLPVTLMLGSDDAQTLYPLCGVLSHMGYDYHYEQGSWQLTSDNGDHIALMTAGLSGLNPGAMGSFNGTVFLCDDACPVYIHGSEAYVTEALLEKIGISVLIVENTPVIH